MIRTRLNRKTPDPAHAAAALASAADAARPSRGAGVTHLRHLAEEYEARSVPKLLATAKRFSIPASREDAEEALRKDVARQVFAPAPRSQGKSAAEGPGSRLQADLIDFSQNAENSSGHRYALAVADVYSRRLWTEPLRSKTSIAVDSAIRGIIRHVPGHSDGR